MKRNSDPIHYTEFTIETGKRKTSRKKNKDTPSYPLVLPMLRTFAVDACAEFKFHPERKWKADFAIPSRMLLIEIDGGAFSGGRHTRGMGFINDMEKLNAAACLGYRVLRFIPTSKVKRRKPLPPVGLEYLHLQVSRALFQSTGAKS